MSKDETGAVRELDGISFEIDQLAALGALELPGVRVEIHTPASSVEELVVFRLRSEPDIVAATLRRSPAGPFNLVGYDLSGEANDPVIEATFPSFLLAIYALAQLFSEECV